VKIRTVVRGRNDSECQQKKVPKVRIITNLNNEEFETQFVSDWSRAPYEKYENYSSSYSDSRASARTMNQGTSSYEVWRKKYSSSLEPRTSVRRGSEDEKRRNEGMKVKRRIRTVTNTEVGRQRTNNGEWNQTANTSKAKRSKKFDKKSSSRILRQNRIEINQSEARTPNQSEGPNTQPIVVRRKVFSITSARRCSKPQKKRIHYSLVTFSPTGRQDSSNKREPTTDMPKTKNTEKKTERKFVCFACEKSFAQRTNFRRHLGLIHECNEAGESITKDEKMRMQIYNKKAKKDGRDSSKPKKRKKSREFVATSASSSPSPKRRASPPSAALGKPPSDSPPASPSRPAVSIEELLAELVISSDEDSTNDYFVFVDDEPTAGPSTVEEEPRTASPPLDPTKGRTSTKPRNPSAVRTLRKTISLPTPIRKPAEVFQRRRRMITAESLARSAADYHKTTKQLAEEIAEHLSLAPTERKRCQDLLRGMRVAQRHLCRRIRMALPMNAGRTERQEFLTWLESTVREIEGRSSDELD